MYQINNNLYILRIFVKLNFIRLQNFRNIEFAEVELGTNSVWIFGKNAQGKTNLLEGIGMFNALRSFRTSATDALISKEQKQADLIAEIETEKFGKCEVQISLSKQKEVFIDGEKITRLNDYLGKFPMLAITNEDLKLLRGTPENRRKDMDMFISSISPEYFEQLRRYHRAMTQRNALLKSDCRDNAMFDAFEDEMATSANVILQIRRVKLDELGKIATEKYAILASEGKDCAEINLKPNCDVESSENFKELLRKNRNSDIEKRTTQRGVHRDDYKIAIDNSDAKLYASEGQQKSAVIAMRLAQFELAKNYLGTEPVMLCDDILGELDNSRRERFWECTNASTQIIATSTELPQKSANRQWKIFNAQNGTFNELA